ncbi:phosphoribosylglycinamide formyltransferase [Leptolyngbya sp. 'hensonii']|uniref:phosphoribosylglycinamide formyltransferase n=1 Tax=Leptolyngbya sp. 'hensonii' TaxID=1922337 RepID=UPI00094F8ABA|nr:phosphoribosylglycinamide formyltransferase [Leptolyngbya sp. 'hensonii']OLP17905.1 phosphoribosylglycinamide formyltransferase [Leptolyngbya sp. 'hensonii']
MVDPTFGFISPDIPPESLRNHLQSGPPLQLGVMASGSGSNFETIAQTIADGRLHAQIQVLIYNNPEAKAAARAARLNIPAVLLNHRDFATREELDLKIAVTLRQFGVEWVIMAGWMRLVTHALIEAFPDRILNIHPSLLPSFPGIHAVEQALKAGVKVAGCTVHIVTLEMDSGPILMQAAVPILPGDNPTTLQSRIQVQEHRIYPRAIALAAALQTGFSWGDP